MAAAVAKFRYSKRLTQAAEKGLVWDRETLMGYLRHPKKFLQKDLGRKRVSNKMVNKFKKKKFRRVIVRLTAVQKRSSRS